MLERQGAFTERNVEAREQIGPSLDVVQNAIAPVAFALIFMADSKPDQKRTFTDVSFAGYPFVLLATLALGAAAIISAIDLMRLEQAATLRQIAAAGRDQEKRRQE